MTLRVSASYRPDTMTRGASAFSSSAELTALCEVTLFVLFWAFDILNNLDDLVVW